MIKSTEYNVKCKDLKDLPALVELLAITMEECAEVQQGCAKVMRFGTNTNKFHLAKEVGDLLAMIDLLVEYDIIDLDSIDAHKQQKRNKLKIYSNLKV